MQYQWPSFPDPQLPRPPLHTAQRLTTGRAPWSVALFPPAIDYLPSPPLDPAAICPSQSITHVVATADLLRHPAGLHRIPLHLFDLLWLPLHHHIRCHYRFTPSDPPPPAIPTVPHLLRPPSTRSGDLQPRLCMRRHRRPPDPRVAHTPLIRPSAAMWLGPPYLRPPSFSIRTSTRYRP